MKTKMNYSLDSELVNELKRISDKIGVAQSKILNEALANALDDIKRLNYNFTKFIRERV